MIKMQSYVRLIIGLHCGNLRPTSLVLVFQLWLCCWTLQFLIVYLKNGGNEAEGKEKYRSPECAPACQSMITIWESHVDTLTVSKLSEVCCFTWWKCDVRGSEKPYSKWNCVFSCASHSLQFILLYSHLIDDTCVLNEWGHSLIINKEVKNVSGDGFCQIQALRQTFENWDCNLIQAELRHTEASLKNQQLRADAAGQVLFYKQENTSVKDPQVIHE